MSDGLENVVTKLTVITTVSNRLEFIKKKTPFITSHANEIHLFLSGCQFTSSDNEKECANVKSEYNGTCLGQVQLLLCIIHEIMRQNRETRSQSLRHPGALVDPEVSFLFRGTQTVSDDFPPIVCC